jgi:hypothetical protein
MRMTVCFQPINLKTFSLKDKDKLKFHYISDLVIGCNINRDTLLEIIQFTFADKCCFNTFGYNIRSQEFSAKKIIKHKFLLHFIIKVQFCDLNSSKIIITPIVADINELSKTLNTIYDIVNLYQPK